MTRRPAEVLLQDGAWVWCQVIGQSKDRHGRWCVGIRWYGLLAVTRKWLWRTFRDGPGSGVSCGVLIIIFVIMPGVRS
jgi:hypothetical protein